MKTILVLVLLCLLLTTYQLQTCSGKEMSMAKGAKIDCKSKCGYRCSEASRTKRCLRACNTCCVRCNCVPPGTYGNTHVCPCYAKLTTHGGKLKCP